MVTCPRCGFDADYLPGDLFSLVNCDFCGDTIDVTELARRDDGDGAIRQLPAVAERPPRTPTLQVA
jgi:hypothetical protein